MTDDLITWLRAQLDEDERIAQAAASEPVFGYGGRWTASDDGNVAPAEPHGNDWVAVGPWGGDLGDVGQHMTRHDPARVLAEVDAKRRLVRTHTPVLGWRCAECHYQRRDTAPRLCLTLHLLALPYADRPGYRNEWRPS